MIAVSVCVMVVISGCPLIYVETLHYLMFITRYLEMQHQKESGQIRRHPPQSFMTTFTKYTLEFI